LDSILTKMKLTEKKVERINIVKTIAISVIMISMICFFYAMDIGTIFSWLGLGLIMISTVVTMVLYWKIQFKSKNLNHNLSQDKFIIEAISEMRNHKKKFTKLFRVFVFFILIGINLLYVDLLTDLELAYRLGFHFGISFFLLIIFFLGLKFREKKFNREFQPLIDDLESI